MLMLSIWIGLMVLAGTLMAADWYLWGPRYQAPAPVRPDRSAEFAQIRLRHAA